MAWGLAGPPGMRGDRLGQHLMVEAVTQHQPWTFLRPRGITAAALHPKKDTKQTQATARARGQLLGTLIPLIQARAETGEDPPLHWE